MGRGGQGGVKVDANGWVILMDSFPGFPLDNSAWFGLIIE